MDGEERQAWFDAEHVDAQSKAQSKTRPKLSELFGILSDANDDLAPENDVSAKDMDANDENATCNNSGENVTHDSREKLEADVRRAAEEMERFSFGERFINTNLILRWLDRQAAITRKTEQAAWIQQANGLIHEANAERDELKSYVEDATADYAKLVKERDELKAKVHDLQIVVDCVDERNKRYCELVSERDNLARDLQDCNREREELRQALGCAIDHAHEIMSLVNLDGEVIG